MLVAKIFQMEDILKLTVGFPLPGNIEISEDGCKQYEVMYSPSCEATRNGTGVDEASANGIVLATEDLGYQIYEVSGECPRWNSTGGICSLESAAVPMGLVKPDQEL